MAKYQFNIDWKFSLPVPEWCQKWPGNSSGDKQKNKFKYEQDWGKFYRHDFPAGKIDGGPKSHHTKEVVHSAKPWINFYVEKILGEKVEESPSSKNWPEFYEEKVLKQEENYASMVVEEEPFTFDFGSISASDFKTKWGKFYHHEFAGGREFEAPRVQKVEKRKPVFHQSRSKLLNPITLIEEIVQEMGEPLPVKEPEIEFTTTEIIEDAPSEIHLRRLKLKKMGAAGLKMLQIIGKAQEKAKS